MRDAPAGRRTKAPPAERETHRAGGCIAKVQDSVLHRLLRTLPQLAALRLTPLRNATVDSFFSAAFSLFRFVVKRRVMSSWPMLSAHAIRVP